MLNAAFAQPLQDRPLRGLGLVKQRVMDEAALFSLSAQRRSRAQVSLISQHNEKFSLLTFSGVLDYPMGNLFRKRDGILDGGATAADGARGC